MRLLAAEGAEAVVGDDVRRAEVLELRAVGAGLLGQRHQLEGSIEAAVVVGGDVGDEVRGLVGADEAVADAEGRHRAIVGGSGGGWPGPGALSGRG